MKIYLIRHGATDWNLQGRLQGREDIPLNANGLAQAEECGKKLTGADFDHIISSPLSRAVKTAEIIAAHMNILPPDICYDLIERDFGKLSGQKPKNVFCLEEEGNNMEPLDITGKRMLSALRAFADKNRGGNFAAVSHGGSINALLRELSGRKIGTGKTRLKNVFVTALDYTNGNFRIEGYNLDAADIPRKPVG